VINFDITQGVLIVKDYDEKSFVLSQKIYNITYLLIILIFILIVYVIFPKGKIEFKHYLSFDQQKGDLIYVKKGSRESSSMSRNYSGARVGVYATHPSMTIIINNEKWYCNCYFSPCFSSQYFNNPFNSGIPDNTTKYLNTAVIENLEVLQLNKQRYCLVTKMRYLGTNYDITTAYQGHGKMYLQDAYLKDIEPIRHSYYRASACFICILLAALTLYSNFFSLRKAQMEA
jgi:hypothetical protein